MAGKALVLVANLSVPFDRRVWQECATLRQATGGPRGYLAERLTYRSAEVVIATNESYREVALARGGKRPEDVFVVRSAPAVERFRRVPAEAGLKRGKPHLLCYLSTPDVCLSPDPLNPLNDVSTMNKIMEYMAMGCPIVSFELAEARVSAGEAALYAPANDERSFAKLIDHLLDDPDERRRRGEIGRGRTRGPLSWAASSKSLLAAYERAISVTGRSR